MTFELLSLNFIIVFKYKELSLTKTEKKMKKLLFTALTAVFLTANAIDLDAIKPKTGDAEFDTHLNEMNVMEKARLELFKAETAKEYKVEKSLIDKALDLKKMQPADVYMTMELAKVSKKNPEEVMKIYGENKEKGWGEIAKKLGIKPGSKEFKRLKAKTKFKKERGKRERLKKEDAKPQKIDKSAVKPVKESKQGKR